MERPGIPGINGKSTEFTRTLSKSHRPSMCYSFLILMLISSFPKIMEYISFRYFVVNNKNQHKPA